MFLPHGYKGLPNEVLPDNALLLLNKFIQLIRYNKSGEYILLKSKDVKDSIYKNLKRKEVKGVINSSLSVLNQRMQIFSERYLFTTSTPLIVGLGLTSVLETSIKLHHIYGVPYIPSSTVKGVLRTYKMWELSDFNLDLFKAFDIVIKLVYEKSSLLDIEFYERLQKINHKELSPEQMVLFEKKNEIIRKQNELLEFLSIFGSQTKKGSLIVFDAYPEKLEYFSVDVMNPHYPDYYQGDEPPSDWQNPVPVKFLTVPDKTKFNFYFLNSYKNLEKDMKNALSVIGIGAKTALGYGVFSS